MARRNSINNKSQELTIFNSSGDPTLQYSVGGTDKFILGVDDDDSDSFKVSSGSGLGTTDRIVSTADGIVTFPAQSMFLNVINAAANVTGDGTTASVGAATATTSVVDRNGDMTEGDGAGTPATFTAPVTGLYQFNFSVTYSIDGSGGIASFQLISTTAATRTSTSYPTQNRVTGFSDGSGNMCVNQTILANMTAGDTTIFQLKTSGGSKLDDIVSGFISGCLIE